ncbi:N-acetylglucosamine-6-phosphate deacetylase [Pseudoneurospora amorphoporcata]|uniref:N-acetylglucosamine-6-phosphate deacetylase n=1 Tax=Pseudoneurospora amorphoporcata TaxID=241081 RepID=A0AAN6NZ75_9PEZI|nr:N-acetylglucosamine-6-phosphate deacetylase [Pseudoneurospora amorphoporcata]
MPAASSSSPPPTGTGTRAGITKLTNGRLAINDALIPSDLFINSQTGKVIEPSANDTLIVPDITIDLRNRIVSPGLIDCQLNGAFGFNFSSFTSSAEYVQNVHTLNTKLIRTGVTSYLPTLTSQTPELYHFVLPHLGPLPLISDTSNNTSTNTSNVTTSPSTFNSSINRKIHRNPQNGSESLGVHVEGPFLSPFQHGIHDLSVLCAANSWKDLEQVYGSSHLSNGAIKMITVAPELGSITALIPSLVSNGIVVSLGHTECTFPEAAAAVGSGAKMITHLFNAMRPLHHREPGLFGLLGAPEEQQKKGLYYGVIADGIHLHPTVVSLAYNLRPQGFILVTDAMHLVGMEDGKYEWVNGGKTEWIEKRGSKLCIVEPPPSASSSSSSPTSSPTALASPLESALSSGTSLQEEGHQNGNVNGDGQAQSAKTNGRNKNGEVKDGQKKKWGGIAGSSATLLECVNNLLQWTGMSVPKALTSVTSTPAEMLGLKGVKGSLQPGADADLVVFEEVEVEVEDLLGGGGRVKRKQLVVDEVWKFGVRVFVRDGNGDGTDCFGGFGAR